MTPAVHLRLGIRLLILRMPAVVVVWSLVLSVPYCRSMQDVHASDCWKILTTPKTLGQTPNYLAPCWHPGFGANSVRAESAVHWSGLLNLVCDIW